MARRGGACGAVVSRPEWTTEPKAPKVYLRPNDGGEDRRCRYLPNERFVIAPGRCPICDGKAVLIAHDVKRTAIFAEDKREQAIAFLRSEGAQKPEGVPPQSDFRVRGENPQEREYSTEADAKCERCRSFVGRLVVPLNTLFGRTEDNLIMSGMYGRVIAP